MSGTSSSSLRETLATEADGATRPALGRRYLAVFEPESSAVVPLPESGELVVGRGDEAGLRLDDAKVSRRHVRIAIVPERAIVTDLESQNGTFVNGERLMGSRLLVSGDVIELGKASIVFHASPGATGPELGGREASFVELEALMSELDREVERSARSDKPLAVLVLMPMTAPDESARERVRSFFSVELVGLERAALDAGSSASTIVLLPEASAHEAEGRARDLVTQLAALGIYVRTGMAAHPADGSSAAALIAGARSAAASAAPGEVRSASEAERLLELGESTILLADAAMLRLYSLIERLAASDLPVLIHGETGSGKELAAQALHHQSTRADKKLVAINCAALHESLAESELFGHEKGAFTGATGAKAGYLESASGGTVFFDEIAELPLTTQAKLLRALDTQKIVRVGDVNERPIDVRIVAATNRDLQREVGAGRFRQDLFFRLSGATLWIPPLRDRPRELSLLARRFLDRARARLGRPAMRVSDEAQRLLASYGWPGNVRELRNAMDFAAAAFDESVLEAWHLADRFASSGAPTAAPAVQAMPIPNAVPPIPIEMHVPGASNVPLGATAASVLMNVPQTMPAFAPPSAEHGHEFRPIEEEVRELEIKRITEALDASGGNQRKAAQLIGMPLRTFVTKLTQYGLRPNR